MKNTIIKGLAITTLALTFTSSANAWSTGGYTISQNSLLGTTTITGTGSNWGHTTTCRYNALLQKTYCN